MSAENVGVLARLDEAVEAAVEAEVEADVGGGGVFDRGADVPVADGEDVTDVVAEGAGLLPPPVHALSTPPRIAAADRRSTSRRAGRESTDRS